MKTLDHGLAINADAGPDYDGTKVSLAQTARKWILRNQPPDIRPFLAPPPKVDQRSWRESSVGWGLVLSAQDEPPQPIRRLLEDREGIILRFSPDDHTYLVDERYGDRLSPASAPQGKDRGHLPRYLLIYGEPDVVPWSLQFVLNASRVVGRLHLKGEALERYVDAAIGEWTSPSQRAFNTLVWSTDYGGGDDDITTLMREAIAEPLQRRYRGDSDIVVAQQFAGESATHAILRSALRNLRPALVVTTSHGRTSPLTDAELLGQSIGLPVDQERSALDIEALLESWRPDGAVWYAHACCSAGCDRTTAFRGLVSEGSALDRILNAIPMAGARIAPLPTALLSAEKPARAFIGHVEPTFDWTIRDKHTRQLYGSSLVAALYDEALSNQPLGLGFTEFFGRLSGVYSAYDQALLAYNNRAETTDIMLTQLLVARDIRSTVFLGDPAVSIV